MIRARLVHLAVAGLLGISVGACGGTAGGASGATASPQASAVPAGTYTSKAFKPAITLTLPDGWAIPSDQSDYYAVIPAGSDIVGINFFRDPKPASQDASCPLTAQEGVAATDSLSMLTWIRSLKGLSSSNPRIVTIGGLHGSEIDASIAPGWKTSCSFANGLPTVSLFVGASGTLRWTIFGSERLRLDILDAPGGGIVVVDQDSSDGSLFDQFLSTARPIMTTLKLGS